MNIRSNVLILMMMLVVSISVMAQQNRRLSKEIRSNMLKAYSYRSDIDKRVLSLTKSWPDKYGILHDDWIENTNGKSVNLNGEEILPQFNYTELERFCDTLYVMKVGALRGVVTKNGRIVMPFKYWKVNFRRIGEGLLFGQQNAAGTGKVDVYDITGRMVCSLDNVQQLDAYYMWDTNEVVLQCRFNGKKEETELHYFPDGTPVTDENRDHGTACPQLFLHSWDSANNSDNIAFRNNYWVKKFKEFYDKKKYADALFCISFFDQEERQALLSDASLPNYITFTSILDCYKILHMDETLVRTVQATMIDHRPPRGVVFDVEKRQVESTLELMYSGLEQKYITGMINDINYLYRSSLQGYQASVAQRQQTAQMWMVALSATATAVTNTLNQMAEAEVRKSTSKPTNSKSGKKVSASSSTVDDTSSSSSDEEEEEKKPVDTSRIDKRIEELEESLRKAEIREAKEHNTETVIYIQSTRDNIKDLKKYRAEMIRKN